MRNAAVIVVGGGLCRDGGFFIDRGRSKPPVKVEKIDLLITDYHLRDGETGLTVIAAMRQALTLELKALLITGDTSNVVRKISQTRSRGSSASRSVTMLGLLRTSRLVSASSGLNFRRAAALAAVTRFTPLRPRHLAYTQIHFARLKRYEIVAQWIGLQRIHADNVGQLIGAQRHEALQLIFKHGDGCLGWVRHSPERASRSCGPFPLYRRCRTK